MVLFLKQNQCPVARSLPFCSVFTADEESRVSSGSWKVYPLNFWQTLRPFKGIFLDTASIQSDREQLRLLDIPFDLLDVLSLLHPIQTV